MKLQQMHLRENERNEDRKRGRHNPNERENEDNEKDALSGFPDCILLHILSFLNAKEAVQTCILSTRWKHLWKHTPTLNLSSNNFTSSRFGEDFRRIVQDFTEFVNQFLSLRDSSTTLNGLDIELWYCIHPRLNYPIYPLLERIVRYAVSHNLNRLRLSYNIDHFPTFLFSCQSLTSLDLEFPPSRHIIFPSSLNLPALTCLKLHYFSFCRGSDGRVEPFSTFNMLNTLILHECTVPDAPQTLCISSTTLLNLSIDTCISSYLKIDLSAPNLYAFAFIGAPSLKLYGSSLSSIKQVSLHIPMLVYISVDYPLILLDWLLELVNIKSLRITGAALKLLSLLPDLMKVKPPWYNLKSLKVELYYHQKYTSRWNVLAGGMSWKENAKLREAIKARTEPYSYIPDGMLDFLLRNSPSTKVDLLIPERSNGY